MKPLSFIILSYNRSADLLELLKNIGQLEQAHELLQEIIVVNNASTENYDEIRSFVKDQSSLPYIYFDAPENLGVAKGRNYALDKGIAPIIIMLDDDAVLQNNDCLINLVKEFEIKNTEKPKAIISF